MTEVNVRFTNLAKKRYQLGLKLDQLKKFERNNFREGYSANFEDLEVEFRRFRYKIRKWRSLT